MSEVKGTVTATCPEAASTMEVPSVTRAMGNSEWPNLLPVSRPLQAFPAAGTPALHGAGHSPGCQAVSEAGPGLV